MMHGILTAVASLVAEHRLLGERTSGSRALEHRLNSSGTWAHLLCGMWDLPGSEIEPGSPSWAGEFFTTEPPGRPKRWSLNADGKEAAEREGADPVQRRGTTDGAVSPRREGSGDQPLGSGVTVAVQSWEGSALQGAGSGSSYPVPQGPADSAGFV